MAAAGPGHQRDSCPHVMPAVLPPPLQLSRRPLCESHGEAWLQGCGRRDGAAAARHPPSGSHGGFSTEPRPPGAHTAPPIPADVRVQDRWTFRVQGLLSFPEQHFKEQHSNSHRFGSSRWWRVLLIQTSLSGKVLLVARGHIMFSVLMGPCQSAVQRSSIMCSSLGEKLRRDTVLPGTVPPPRCVHMEQRNCTCPRGPPSRTLLVRSWR